MWSTAHRVAGVAIGYITKKLLCVKYIVKAKGMPTVFIGRDVDGKYLFVIL